MLYSIRDDCWLQGDLQLVGHLVAVQSFSVSRATNMWRRHSKNTTGTDICRLAARTADPWAAEQEGYTNPQVAAAHGSQTGNASFPRDMPFQEGQNSEEVAAVSGGTAADSKERFAELHLLPRVRSAPRTARPSWRQGFVSLVIVGLACGTRPGRLEQHYFSKRRDHKAGARSIQCLHPCVVTPMTPMSQPGDHAA